MSSQWKNFKVIKRLGEGATGEVFLVEDATGLKALKFLKIQPLKMVTHLEVINYAARYDVDKIEAGKILRERRSKLLLAGFKHEAETLKKLDHKNIARFYDVGYRKKENQYYLLCEYIEGSEIFTFTRGKSIEEMEKLFIDLLRGLNYLHNKKIYHFDLKTENVLVRQSASSQYLAKIIDFGISNFHIRPEYQKDPKSSNPLAGGPGSPPYMAPEVWLGERKDNRADLYSVGILFYRCLTGKLPFEGESMESLKEKHCHEMPMPPSQHNQLIPAYWDRIVLRLLEKNPNNRYPDVAFVIRDIRLLSRKNYEVETDETKFSYLPKRGNLIGREKEIALFDQMIQQCLGESPLGESPCNTEKKGPQLLIVRGGKGTGKSRLLEEFGFHTKLNYGFTVQGWEDLQSPKDQPVSSPVLFLLDELNDYSREMLRNALLKYEELGGKPPSFILSTLRLIPSGFAQGIRHYISAPRGRVLSKDKEAPVFFVAVENNSSITWPLCQELSLTDFTMEEVKKYLTGVVRSDEPPQTLIRKIYETTQGNPLLLTELLHLLVTKNLLVDAMGPWPQKLLEDFSFQMPELSSSGGSDNFCAEEIKEAHLNPLQQKAMHYLSAFREPPTLEELAQVTGEDLMASFYNFLSRHLLVCQDNERLYFKRVSLGAFVYRNIPTSERNEIHEALARFFEKQKKTKETLWHQGLAEVGAVSIDTLSQLAQLHENEISFEQAIPCYQKILEKLSDTISTQKIMIQAKLAKAFFVTGKFKEVREVASQVLSEPLQSLDRKMADIVFSVNDLCIQLSLRERNNDEARSRIEFVQNYLVPFLDIPENKAKKLFFENRRAQFYLMQNDLFKAENIFMETNKAAETLNPEEKESLTNNDLDEVYFLQNQLSQARKVCEEKLSQSRSVVQKNRCRYLLGRILFKEGKATEALTQWESCVESARAMNDLPSLFRAYNVLGAFYFEKETDLEKAKDYWERALLLAQKNHDTLSSGAIASNLGRLFHQLKNYQQASHYLNHAIMSFEAVMPQTPMVLSQIVGAKIEFARNLRYLKEWDKAKKIIQEIERLFEEPHPFLTHLESWFYEEKINLALRPKDIKSQRVTP